MRIALFAPRCAIALLIGALAVMRLPALPSAWIAISLCAIGAGWWLFARRARWGGALLFGFGWACVISAHALALRIPPALVGETVVVSGRIVGLPQRDDRLQRFDLRADVASNTAGSNAAGVGGRLLHLSWDSKEHNPAPGERWRLPLRLKRPRGTMNPGGFDFERWALQRRIAANGYVRDDGSAQRLSEASGIDALRARLSQRIADAVPTPGSRFVRALALGDTRWLSQHDWEVLRGSGLTHLIAISGFHVGIVAGFGALLAWLLYALVPWLGLRLPRPQAQAVAGLIFASGYTALAGFELPTVRTLLMIAAALAARLWRRPASVAQSLALALIMIVLVDPLAVLAAGFWLSFAGVAWLVWCLPDTKAGEKNTGGHVRAHLSAQGVATLGLLPLTVWFFGQASLVSPLSNLFGIPWISLVAVPLSLLGLAIDQIAPGIGVPLLRLAAWSMDAIWPLLEHMAAWPGALAWLPEPSLPALLLALAGAFWLLLPRGVPGKPLAVLLLLPLLWPQGPRIAPGEAELAMIDVGQGLSVLVRTQHHTLLYDAGPSYSGGLDLGEAAVVPSLHALGVPRLDALVISHGDNDHAGGADAVLQVYPVHARFGAPGWPRGIGYAPCLRDIAWHWDGVEFRFLHPPLFFPYLKNDSGCVLRIAGPGWSALLPADIEAVIEERLLHEQPELLHVDVVTVPHHGSHTSSTPAFVQAVAPKYALIGVGYRNRFHHPRPEVVQRWLDVGSEVEDTASAGMLRLRLGTAGAHMLSRERERQRRFWQEPVESAASTSHEPSTPSASPSLK